MSQEDLAGRCDLEWPYISLIEAARKQPIISVLLRLAEGLDYSLQEFMKRNEVESRVKEQGSAPPPIRTRRSRSGL